MKHTKKQGRKGCMLENKQGPEIACEQVTNETEKDLKQLKITVKMKNLLECLKKFELREKIISKLKCGLIIKIM